jgi:hypothetical protein
LRPDFELSKAQLTPFFVQQAFERPLNRETKPHSSRQLQRWEPSVADASLSVQKDLLHEDKILNQE